MSAIAMAEKNTQQEEQAKVPVLSVLKNNAILKNIFIVFDENDHKEDQTVLIGRHPHCNIVLTHPSVSRFHLRICSNPSSRALSIVDLNSVHGTWVCGKKLEAGVSVELKEGDTFMVGVSTRVYRLSWVSLTQFNVFVPQQHENDYQRQEIITDENVELNVDQEIQVAEDIVSIRCDEERKSHSEDEAFRVVNRTETLCVPANFGGENILCDCQNRVLSPPYIHSVDELDNVQNIEACPEVEMPEDTNLLCTLREYLKENICLPVVEAVQGTKMQQFQAPPDTFTGQPFSFDMHGSSLPTNIDPTSSDEKYVSAVDIIPTESEFGCMHGDNDVVEDILTTGARILNSENMCLLVDDDSKFQLIEVVEEDSVDSVPGGEKQDECKEEHESKFQDLNAKSCCEEGYSLDEIVDNNENKCIENMDPAASSFDEKNLAAVTEIPTEFEFECAIGDNERIEHILATESIIINSENTSLLDEEATKFQLINIVDGIAVDSISDVEKEDKFGKELQPSLNAKFCQEKGTSADEIAECNSANEITEDGASFDEKGLAAVTTIPTESEFRCTLIDERIEDILATESTIKNSEDASFMDVKATKFQLIKIVEEVAMDSISHSEKEKCGKELQACLNAKFCQEQVNSVDEIAEGNRCASSISSISSHVGSPNSSMPQEAVLNITNKTENQTPQSLTAVTGWSARDILENWVEPSEKSSTFGNSWSRRGKAASAPQVRARKSRFMSTSNVDTEVKMSNVKDVINKSMPKDLSSVFDEEEETFTPNKENLSPNTYHLRFMRKKGNLEEIKHSKSQRSCNLKDNWSTNIYSAERLSAVSNKVNQSPKEVAQERKSRRKPLECRINLAHEQDMRKLKNNTVERLPFQSLMISGGNRKSVTVSAARSIDDDLAHEQDMRELKNNRVERLPFQSLMISGGNRKSVTVSAARSIDDDDARICGQISNKCTRSSHISREQKRSWDMVVDTASLLNKESRKALQLLQGLKGTRLIIPRLVIKELGSMKQQFRIFRTTSEASLALEWIEECMEKTRWWIQIQSSTEECRLTAPAPSASPQTQFIGKSWAFPGFKISNDCASPTTLEDHILDCALEYRRKENVGLVLLSDDVTLKIKSMAKGLLCETVQQFRQSLVNPFSERFMWPKSSPRGLTWSCHEDVVLKEKYCGLPSKAGLKLIT